ncbi:MAG: Xaa-His dipeptidase [Clostridium sp.]
MTNEDKIKQSLALIVSMVEKGSSEREIAEEIGIPYSTFKRHKAQNVSLKEQMAHAKDKRTHAVELALHKIAIGYSYYEEIATKVKEEVLAEDGKTILIKERVKVSSVKKHRGPDLAAQKFYLINRKNKDWKDDPNKVKYDSKMVKLKEKEIDNKGW